MYIWGLIVKGHVHEQTLVLFYVFLSLSLFFFFFSFFFFNSDLQILRSKFGSRYLRKACIYICPAINSTLSLLLGRSVLHLS